MRKHGEAGRFRPILFIRCFMGALSKFGTLSVLRLSNRWFRTKSNAVHGYDAVSVFLSDLGGNVHIAHFRNRLTRSVMIRHGLEQRATKFADWLLRHFCQFLSVTLQDELFDTAFEIGLCIPRDLCSLLSFRGYVDIKGSWWRGGVARGPGLHVFCPGPGYGFVGQPDRFVLVAFEFSGRFRLVAKQWCQPRLAGVHRLEFLVYASLVLQTHRETGVKKRDREVTAVTALVAGARVGREPD